MKLHPLAFAGAASLTALSIHVLRTLVIYADPGLMVKHVGWIFYISNVESLIKFRITQEDLILGTLHVIVVPFIIGFVFAHIYNFLHPKHD